MEKFIIQIKKLNHKELTKLYNEYKIRREKGDHTWRTLYKFRLITNQLLSKEA